MKHSTHLALPLAIGMLIPAMSAIANPGDDRFTLRVAAMNAEGSGTLHGTGSGPGAAASFSEEFGFGSKEVSPRLDGVFRLSGRTRLIFDYFRFGKDTSTTLGQAIDIDGTTLPAGSFAKAESKFQLASLIYDFSVIDTSHFSAGLQIGAEYASIDGRVIAEAGEDTFRTSTKQKGVAPVVGLRLTATPGDRWMFSTQAHYLDAGWGNFDFSGSIKRANAIAEYRVTPSLGLFAGYDWFRINYGKSGRDASGAVDVEFKGPMAGLTVAF